MKTAKRQGQVNLFNHLKKSDYCSSHFTRAIVVWLFFSGSNNITISCNALCTEIYLRRKCTLYIHRRLDTHQHTHYTHAKLRTPNSYINPKAKQLTIVVFVPVIKCRKTLLLRCHDHAARIFFFLLITTFSMGINDLIMCF